MKNIFLSFVCLLLFKIASAQCELQYESKTFSKVEYYTLSDGKLKLLRTSYSTNTVEILKNTSGTEGDMLAITGNLLGKYVQFIKEFECKIDDMFTKYTLYTSDGRTDDIWTVYLSKTGNIYSVNNIRGKDNLVIKFK